MEGITREKLTESIILNSLMELLGLGEWIETVTGKIPIEDMGKTLVH